MIFDLFYNQFVQVIDSVELAGGAIFRTILTDYNLPDWSRIQRLCLVTRGSQNQVGDFPGV